MINFGSVPAGAVLPIFFTSYDANGASVTLTGLAVTDIEVYKGTSMTQRASDAGYTLLDTDGIDIDSVTGLHGFSIDTGDNTDASFYSTGGFFTVVVSAVTIDTQTVTFIAATFRLVAAETAAGVRKVDVSHFGGTAGTFASGRAEVNTSHLAGTSQTARDIGASVLLSSGTGTGQVVLTSGIVSADTTKWSGTAVPTPDTAGYPKVTVKVGTGTGELSLSSGAVKIQTGLKKNQALLNFPFQMTDSTNHNPATGLTVSVSVALDGAASFTSVGTATEMANGWYQIDLTAGNMNGDTVSFKAIATGADDLGITIITEP